MSTYFAHKAVRGWYRRLFRPLISALFRPAVITAISANFVSTQSIQAPSRDVFRQIGLVALGLFRESVRAHSERCIHLSADSLREVCAMLHVRHGDCSYLFDQTISGEATDFILFTATSQSPV